MSVNDVGNDKDDPKDKDLDNGFPDRVHPVQRSPGWLDRLSTRRGLVFVGIISLLLLVLAIAGGWYAWRNYPLLLGRTIEIEPPASIEDLIEAYPELAPILANSELDSVYKEFFVVYQEGGPDAALELARKRGMLTQNDELRMTLELDTSDSAELAASLEARGIKVTAASGNVIDIAIPLSVLEAAIQAGNPGSLFQDLPGLEHIVRIRLPRINLQDAGSVEIETLEEIGVQDWHTQGYFGEGIRIGVLDMGFDGYKDLLGTDLPESVTAQSFIYGSEIDDTGTNHGTACAEVIFDIAPGAEYVFAAYETDAEMRQAVEWLRTQDLDIISNSTGSIYGPMDGSGVEALMVDSVVDSGILWVNSAGNSADTHYRGVFTDENDNGFHEFVPGDEMMGFAPQDLVVMVLNWDDWGVGQQDFDLYVIDEDQNEIAVSQNIQDGSDDDPAEIVRYFFPDSGPYYIAFYARNVSRPVTFDFFIYNSELQYFTPDYSITTPADARRAFTVGATFWEDDSLEYYSSRGPTADGRLKPEISAPAGVSVASRDRPFFGTSASTPHVSGVAALVLQANPGFQPDDLMNYLQNQAIDLGASGPDYEFGHGRLWIGDAPLAGAVEPTATAVGVTPTATQPVEEAPPAVATSTSIPTPEPAEEESTFSFGSIGTAELLVLCACVGLPGLLGLAGVGLVGGIWFYRRSRPSPAPPPPPAPVRRPPPSPPSYAPRVEPTAQVSPGQHVCPRCKTPHQPEARFCNACGFELTPAKPGKEASTFCDNCGAALRPTAKFCPRCGHKR